MNKQNCSNCEYNCDNYCEMRDGYVKVSSNPSYKCDNFVPSDLAIADSMEQD